MEALVSTMIGLSETQWVRTGAEMKADFKAWKDFWAASVKFHGIPLWVNWVSSDEQAPRLAPKNVILRPSADC